MHKFYYIFIDKRTLYSSFLYHILIEINNHISNFCFNFSFKIINYNSYVSIIVITNKFKKCIICIRNYANVIFRSQFNVHVTYCIFKKILIKHKCVTMYCLRVKNVLQENILKISLLKNNVKFDRHQW